MAGSRAEPTKAGLDRLAHGSATAQAQNDKVPDLTTLWLLYLVHCQCRLSLSAWTSLDVRTIAFNLLDRRKLRNIVTQVTKCDIAIKP